MNNAVRKATDNIISDGRFLTSDYMFSVGSEQVVYIFSKDPAEAYHFFKQLQAQGFSGCFLRFMFGVDAVEFCQVKYVEHTQNSHLHL